MRNFRAAAVAAATATAVAFSATPAFAADAQDAAAKKPSLSAKIGAKTEADQPADGRDLLGTDVNDENNPQWAIIWRDLTYAGIATAAISTVIAAYNFAVYNGMIPDFVGDVLNGSGF